MNNKSKPQACSVFGIRGAKVMPFLEMTTLVSLNIC